MVENPKIKPVSHVLIEEPRHLEMTKTISATDRMAELITTELIEHQRAEIERLRDKTVSMKAKLATQK